MSKKEITIVTPLREYKLKDLNIKGIPNVEFLKTLDVDISKSKYIKDPNKFIQTLKQDYHK